MWIDTERYVPLQGRTLRQKRATAEAHHPLGCAKIEGAGFLTIVFKDMLKQGDGTEFRMTKVQFDQEIPAYLFTKAALEAEP